jgi:hypothetical protein
MICLASKGKEHNLFDGMQEYAIGKIEPSPELEEKIRKRALSPGKKN